MIIVFKRNGGWAYKCGECPSSLWLAGSVLRHRVLRAAEAHRDSGAHTPLPIVQVVTES